MIKQFVPSEICLSCQGCCRFKEEYSPWAPRLFTCDIQALLEHAIPPSLITQEKTIRLLPVGPVQQHCSGEGFICPFLGKENKCKIYEFRPFECQLYPFLLHREGQSLYLALDIQCPCPAEEGDEELKLFAGKLMGLLTDSPYREIIAGNFQHIPNYSGIEKIGRL